MPTVLYKLGGSLLDLPDFPDRIGRLISGGPPHLPLLVVGGGAVADVVRRWSERHPLDEVAAHWLAVEAMTLNEHFVATILPKSGIAQHRKDAEELWADGRIPVVGSMGLLNSALEEPDQLPASWDVTSDSIAAWIACRFQAERLVLLKSTALPTACTLADAVRQGLVDRHFPQLAPRLPHIDWCHLRAESPTITPWLSGTSAD